MSAQTVRRPWVLGVLAVALTSCGPLWHSGQVHSRRLEGAPRVSQLPSFPPETLGDLGTRDDRAADDIVAAVRQAYAECDTYRDTGELASTIEGVPGTAMRRIQTVFRRPYHLRLEMEVPGTKGCRTATDILHSDACGARLYRTGGHTMQATWSLPTLVMQANQRCDGPPLIVPSLLMPLLDQREGRFPPRTRHLDVFSASRRFTRLSDVRVDGVVCYRIQADREDREPDTWWVDQRTHLVRRVEWTTNTALARSHNVLRIHPEVDRPVTPEELAFYES